MSRNIKISDILLKLLWVVFVFPFKILLLIFRLIGKAYNKISKRFYFSITFKTTVVYTLIFSLMLLILSGTVLAGLAAYFSENEKSNLERDLASVSSYISSSQLIPEDKINELSRIRNTTITLFDKNHNVLYTTQQNKVPVPFYDSNNSTHVLKEKNSYLLSLNSYQNPGASNQNNSSFSFLSLSMSLRDKIDSGTNELYIQITNKLSGEYTIIGDSIIVLLVLDLIFIIMTIIIGSLTSKKMMKPVHSMTSAVKNISINALDTRLDVSGSMDELKELSETFNNMLDRLQESYERQNQFVSDASHELRTPIAVIQGYANMLDRWGKDDRAVLEESITAIKSESENMKDLVDKLLFLARSDKNTQKIEKENFYINELIDNIISETKIIDTQHEILCSYNEPIMINADPSLIKQALRIFIDNSIKYTPENGRITISSAISKKQLQVTIEDTGIGISKEDLPHIFDRFYRADKSRTKQTGGTGLGLAIAKWIIERHKGTIIVESKINAGTKIIINLPISTNQ
jgi:heavy metal sensor kinase